jgi:hypothetical protein
MENRKVLVYKNDPVDAFGNLKNDINDFDGNIDEYTDVNNKI